jgi:peptidoglycan/LPS O-acetylase OafA/YrhL
VYCGVLIPSYPLHGIWRQNYPGHLTVLIFFALSGYVIGLTTRNKLEWNTVGGYIKKRLFRLYPIYLLAIVFALLVTHNHYSTTTLLANLFFLQRKNGLGFIDEILVNWSLHYEVIFYFLFIPLSVYAIKPAWAFWASLAVGVFFQVVVPIESLSMYGFGFSFWLAGLYLSQAQFPRFTPSRATLLGLLMLVLCFTQLNFAYWLIHEKFHLDLVGMPTRMFIGMEVPLSDLAYLPLCVLLIADFTDRRIPFRNLLMGYVVLMPLLFIVFEVYSDFYRNRPVDFNEHILSYVYYALAVLFLAIGYVRKQKENNLLPSFMVWLGSISYSVYLIHMIIIFAVFRSAYFPNTLEALLGRIALMVALTVVVSYLLEKKVQPYVVSRLRRFIP